jgi:nitroreductase
MSMLEKLAANMVGRLRATPTTDVALERVTLPSPQTSGGMPLFDALSVRHSERRFTANPLSLDDLSGLLWAADGVNRRDTGGRTAPSAMNAREVFLYAALETGLYSYDPDRHALDLVQPLDARRLTGYQDFVDTAPLELIYVVDHSHGLLIPKAMRSVYAAASAGAMAQNVYLYCAARGLATVVRGWFDRQGLAAALALGGRQEVLLAQTVGYPAR